MNAAATPGLRDLFARKSDPYAGADLALAKRAAAIGWILASLLTYGLAPFFPFDARIGALGWVVFVLNSVLVGAIFEGVRRAGDRAGFGTLYITAYGGIFTTGLIQWLAGGMPAPYHVLFGFLIVANALVHSPRRFVCFISVLAVVAIVPEALAGNDVGSVTAEVALWAMLSPFLLLLMATIRAQRAGLHMAGEHANQLARTDPLTGLGNRRAFDEAISVEIERARAGSESLRLVLVDVDRFKAINDEHGHLVGDAYLRAVADAIREELRTGDACFRWGGDEFVILLASEERPVPEEICERLRDAVSSACRRPDGDPLTVTCASAEAHDPLSADMLLEEADRALLAIKASRDRSAL